MGSLSVYETIIIMLTITSSMVGVMWFTLRLYIGNELLKLRVHIDQQFINLHQTYETKSESNIKYQHMEHRLAQVERKHGLNCKVQ